MEDKDVAILRLSEILQQNVVDLQFKPQESVGKVGEPHLFTIYRMDFSAKIQLPNQQFKQVLIEIQKAKFHTDILRFRNYLGMQYSNKENVVIEPSDGKEIKHALPNIRIKSIGYNRIRIKKPPKARFVNPNIIVSIYSLKALIHIKINKLYFNAFSHFPQNTLISPPKCDTYSDVNLYVKTCIKTFEESTCLRE